MHQNQEARKNNKQITLVLLLLAEVISKGFQMYVNVFLFKSIPVDI